jgi:hypothetical protein
MATLIRLVKGFVVSEAFLARQSRDHNPYLLLGRILSSGCSPNIANELFGRFRLPLKR